MAVSTVITNAYWDAISPSTLGGQQRKIARLSNGDLVCCYHRIGPDGWMEVFCSTSTDGGITWTEERVTTLGGYSPAMAVDSNDTLHIVYGIAAPTEPHWVVVYYTMKTIGGTWSATVQVNDVVAAHQERYQSAIAVDSLDNIHVVWSGEGYGANPNHPNIQYKQKTAAGVWGAQEAITDQAGWNEHPSIAIDAVDTVHVVWDSDVAPTWMEQINYRQRAAGVWGAMEVVATDAANVQEYPCIALDSAGDPHVTWQGANWGVFLTTESILYRHRLAGVWQATEVVMNWQFGGIDKDRRWPTICIDAADDVWVAAFGDGDMAMDVDNIYYDKRPWSAGKGTLGYDATPRQQLPVMAWAFHPIIEGTHTNIPVTGFALIWTINQLAEPPPFPTPEVWFFTSPTLRCSEVEDGYVAKYGPDWDTVHDAASGDELEDTDVSVVVAAIYSIIEGFAIARAFLYYDTSDIPPEATINWAKLALYPEEVFEVEAGCATLHVVEGVQAVPLELDDFGRHLDKVVSAGSIAFGDWVPDSYNEIELDLDVCRDWIIKGGLTKLCLRVAPDINDTPLTLEGENSVSFFSTEKGIGYCPKLIINYSLPPPVVPPTLTTDPATDIEATAATLKGTLVDDGGEACGCGFEWGETEAYEHGATSPQSKTTGQEFLQAISGLSPNTTYHFRAQAKNSAGTASGADRTFTTQEAVTVNRAYALSREEL